MSDSVPGEQAAIDAARARAAAARRLAWRLEDAVADLPHTLATAGAGLVPGTWTGASARQRANELRDVSDTLTACFGEVNALGDDLVHFATVLELRAEDAQQALLITGQAGGG